MLLDLGTIHQGDRFLGFTAIFSGHGFFGDVMTMAEEDYRWMRTYRYPYCSRQSMFIYFLNFSYLSYVRARVCVTLSVLAIL